MIALFDRTRRNHPAWRHFAGRINGGQVIDEITELDNAARIDLPDETESTVTPGKGVAKVIPIPRHREPCDDHPNLAAQWRIRSAAGIRRACVGCRIGHVGVAVADGGAR